MDDYLEDIGAEVEINPDEVEYYDSSVTTPVKRKKPRKTKLLSKGEKKVLLDMLNGLLSNYSKVASTVYYRHG